MKSQILQKPEKSEKPELKKFLSMELAERLIRVEQTVSASFNKDISYDQTAYYKGMSPKEKAEFDKYLKNKKNKKVMFSSSIFVCMFALSLFGSGITGNVTGIGETSRFHSLPEIILSIILGILIIYGIYSFISGKMQDKKFKQHSEIIEDFAVTKRVRRS